MKKVLGIIAIVGLGALLYYQYKKMTKKGGQDSATPGVKPTINYAAAREKTKADIREKTKTALKGKFAELKQQNQ